MQEHVFLVAGASGGIGSAIAGELFSAGAQVFLLGRSLDRLKAAFPSAPERRAQWVVCDLADLASVGQAAASVVEAGRLDGLILSAGIYRRSSDPATFRSQFDTNVLGPYALVRELLPALIASQGQVVFVNSSQALKAASGVGQFAATMHAAKALADSLRDEVNAQGVRVMSLFLGRTAGERQQMIFSLEQREYLPERLIQPNDVARTVLFMLQLPRTVEITDLSMRSMLKS
jgi:NADP-dependent 3-hydroxy acid dehydrogenase YdfG